QRNLSRQSSIRFKELYALGRNIKAKCVHDDYMYGERELALNTLAIKGDQSVFGWLSRKGVFGGCTE
ncbi:MAG: hypothetical protein AAGJ35_10305, partial [Myxococcota bacterium]